MTLDTLDLRLVVRRLADDAHERLAADAVAIWLRGPDGSELQLVFSEGLDRPETAAHLAHRPATRLRDWLITRRLPAVAPVKAADAVGDRAWLVAENAHSLLAVPIASQATNGVSIGVLAALRRRRPFPAGYLARAVGLASSTAAALHAARRFEEQRARADRAETLLAVTQALAGRSDLAVGLDETARLTTRALGATHCDIRLGAGEARADDAPGSALVVPIVRKYQAIGSMRLTGGPSEGWTPAAVELATAIASQIALAVEKARLYREANEQANELTALREVTTTLASALDLPSVLDAIAEAALGLIGANRCVVFELDPATQTLHPRTARGMAAHQWPHPLRLGQGVAGTAALRRAPVLAGDLERDPPPFADQPPSGGEAPSIDVLRERGYRAVLSVPVVSKEQVVGAINIYWDEPHDYSEREVSLLTDLAQHAAVAVDRARVHGAAVRRAEELAALLRAARTLMAGLDPKATLEHIVHEASGIAGTPHVKVMLLDTPTQSLRVAALTGSPAPAEPSVPLGAIYSGRVAVSGEPLYIADVQHDAGGLAVEGAHEAGIVTYLGLPIKMRDRVLGVLSFNTTAPRRYTAAELAYLGSFADLAAIALDNAHLYDAAQRSLADLKAVQQKLVQGETLRALGELAGGAAHHLNNLLTIVVGRVQLLLRAAPDESGRRPLAIIEKAAKDGAEVVRRLQQFSRMRQVAQPRVVRLDELLRDVIELTRGRWQDTARAHGLTIAVETRLGGVPPIAGDPAALREAFTNIVLNAVDAMPKGGRLLIETGVEGTSVRASVSDTGTGMSEAVRLKAQEPFFTTKGVKATGLGLSVAYGIVQSHGGEMTISSEEGAGTTVSVCLPRASGTTEAPAPIRAPATGPLRVLLVDDEAEVRDALTDMLAAHGHTVLTAVDGEEALLLLEREPDLDLVLTDLVMPGMTGWDIAGATKSRRPHVPVGLVTGWGEPIDADDARRATVDFIIDKPVTMEALEAAIARVRGL